MDGRVRILTSHENTGHVLVTARDSDHSIEVVAACCCLYLVGNEVARLQRVSHSTGTHANAIADTDSTELVPNQPCFSQRCFDLLAQAEKMLVASLRVFLMNREHACTR